VKLTCTSQIREYKTLDLLMQSELVLKVRENKAVCLTAIGGEAVAKTIRAICHARLYLEVCALQPHLTTPSWARLHSSLEAS